MVRKNHTSVIEEVFNAITHGFGIVLGIIGLVFLLILAKKDASILKNTVLSIFGGTVIFSYLISTLYHSLFFTRAKKVFKILDHSSIFLLIAGTYTPFTLLALKGLHGLVLTIIVWTIAIFGIVFKSIWVHKFQKISVLVYLLLSWSIVVELNNLVKAIPVQSLIFIGIGGLFYTSGITFYLYRKLPFHHAIWHIFVLCGSILHFCALFYL